MIKVKPPKEHLEQAEAKKVYEKHNLPVKSLADRVRNVVQSARRPKSRPEAWRSTAPSSTSCVLTA